MPFHAIESIFPIVPPSPVPTSLIPNISDFTSRTIPPIPYESNVGIANGTLITLFATLDILLTKSLSDSAFSEESVKAPKKSPFHAIESMLLAVPAMPVPTSATPLTNPLKFLTINPNPEANNAGTDNGTLITPFTT